MRTQLLDVRTRIPEKWEGGNNWCEEQSVSTVAWRVRPCAALEIHLVVSILCLSKDEINGDPKVSIDGREGIQRRPVLLD